MDKVIALIKKLAEDKFYGSLEIKFEAGKVVLLRMVQTIKTN